MEICSIQCLAKMSKGQPPIASQNYHVKRGFIHHTVPGNKSACLKTIFIN